MSKARKDIDPKFQWDFTHIFPSKAAWEAAYKEAEEAIPQISALEGKLCSSAEALKAGLDKINEVAEKAEIVYLYAMLHKSGDNGDPENQEMEGRAINLLVALGTASAFIEPEILASDDEAIRSYMEKPEMKTYRHMLEDVMRGRKYMLSAEQEKMLAMLSDVTGHLQLLLGTQHQVNLGHLCNLGRFQLSIATGHNHKGLGMLASNATNGLTTFFVGQLGYRASVDYTKVYPLTCTSLAHAMLGKKFAQRRSFGKVQLTTQGVKDNRLILKNGSIYHWKGQNFAQS